MQTDLENYQGLLLFLLFSSRAHCFYLLPFKPTDINECDLTLLVCLKILVKPNMSTYTAVLFLLSFSIIFNLIDIRIVLYFLVFNSQNIKYYLQPQAGPVAHLQRLPP